MRVDEPRDAFDPDRPLRHWVDEEGNFAGWMTEEEEAQMLEQSVEGALVDERDPSEFSTAETASRAYDEELPF